MSRTDTVFTGNIATGFAIVIPDVVIFVSFRAAQTYSIPRKTLRNWMKRLHIKSQFPMPKQLKQAAERKKNSQVKSVRGSKIILNAIELS